MQTLTVPVGITAVEVWDVPWPITDGTVTVPDDVAAVLLAAGFNRGTTAGASWPTFEGDAQVDGALRVTGPIRAGGYPDLAGVATSGAYGDLSGCPTMAAVATSGAYGDLTGRPDLTLYAALAGAAFTGVVKVTSGTGALKIWANDGGTMKSVALS